MNWKHRKEKPESGCRILIYSPVYEGRKDQTMLYRIIDSDFLKTMKDAEYWTYLNPPYKKLRNKS